MNDTITGKKVRQTTWPTCKKVQILICKMELHLEIWRLEQRFSNCGPRTTSGPWVLPLWSF